MTIKKILTEPDPFLRQKSSEVEQVTDETRKLMDDMLETMYDAPGIGLAAIQIGVPKRVIVIDLSRDEKKNPLYFVNPKIIKKSDTDSTYEEGCLSVPGQFAEVDRPDKCHISFLDYNGKKQELKA
ncbi:MAG: peptide deformylase, partial [Pelagibacteraceae bacterium]